MPERPAPILRNPIQRKWPIKALAALLLLSGFLLIGDALRHPEGVGRPSQGSRSPAGKVEETVSRHQDKREQQPARGDEQHAAQVRSLLDLRPGEVSMIRIPADDLNQAFGEPGSDTDPVKSRISALAKDDVKLALEEMLAGGTQLQAKVADGAQTAYSNGELRLDLMIAADGGPSGTELIVMIADHDFRMTKTETVANDSAVLIRSLDPRTGAILVIVGTGTAEQR